MQNELSSRIEKIWAMAEIALSQGFVDYSADGHNKIARISGLTFKFIDDTLVRLCGPRLDVAVLHHKPQEGLAFFPGTETVIQFLRGDDKNLARAFGELASMQRVFSKKAA